MGLKAVASQNPANVSITGGTITGTNVPYVLSQSGIPFIGLSSGSVAANGAISAITALPVAYAAAYCWFPANILATVKAAGWYYCTFSTTTAGTAFLDTYTSGTPTIPSSPTAVTDGKGAFTGDTGEEFGPTNTVPAGAMGPNGRLIITTQFSMTNNANAKTGRVRFSGNAGTTYNSLALASGLSSTHQSFIQNRGVANSQVGGNGGLNTSFTFTGSAGQVSAVDTSVATSVVMSLQRATATDNAVLEAYQIMLAYGA